MRLRFRGARTNGRPGDEVGKILRRNRIERLGGGRQAELGEIAQQLARHVQTFLNMKRVVHVRIVDEPLPAHGGARLLEIHAHHDKQGIAHLVGQFFQTAGVLVRRFEIVNRTRTDDHEQPVVLVVENTPHRLAPGEHGFLGALGERQRALHFLRGREEFLRKDVDVVDLFFGHII